MKEVASTGSISNGFISLIQTSVEAPLLHACIPRYGRRLLSLSYWCNSVKLRRSSATAVGCTVPCFGVNGLYRGVLRISDEWTAIIGRL